MMTILVALGFGAIISAVIVLIALRQPQVNCPDCHRPLPRVRRPANRQQAMWGGTSCPHCGCEVDRVGNKVAPRA